MGGVGKTTLVVEAAHRVAEKHLPGGILMVDLQGYGAAPVTADQAVFALLDALGITADGLPDKPLRRRELYQRTLAERKEPTLLFLDNAGDPAQYLPLLPAQPGADRHPVVITSRNRPDSLALDVVGLEELTPEDSAELIKRVLGDDRPLREPDALVELAGLCGHLPLALQIAAAALRRRRPRGIASLVTDIGRSEDLTVALDAGGQGTDEAGRPLFLRPVLAASCQRLPEDLARLLRLLALAPGRDIGASAVAELVGLGVEGAYEQLEKLAGAHLVTTSGIGGDGEVRWRLHDLVRAYALGLTRADTRLKADGDAARRRLLNHYRSTAEAAVGWLRWSPDSAPPNLFAGRDEALAWLGEERLALIAAARWNDDERFAPAASQLAESLWIYLAWRRYYDDWVALAGAAQDAADPAGEAVAGNRLGLALRDAGDLDGAIEEHTRARDLYRAAGDRHGEAMACGNLGNALRRAGRTKDAIRAQTQARDLFRAVGDVHGQATACGNLGLALQASRRYPQALNAHYSARVLFATAGDPRGEAIAWDNLGITFTQAHRPDEAVEPHTHAARLFEELSDWAKAAQAYERLAQVHESLGQRAAARRVRGHVAWCRHRTPPDGLVTR